MVVLILTNNDAGLYKFRYELVKRLCKDYEVYISLPDGEYIGQLEEAGCKYLNTEFNRRGMNPFADLRLSRTYIKTIRKIKPDVVLTYTIKPNVYGGFASRITKTPYLVNVTGLGTTIENGGLLAFLITHMYKIGLKKAACVFFQNSQNQSLFEEKKIVSGKHRLLPGSGVNLAVHTLEAYPDPTEAIDFLFVGRVMKDKGIEELLSAVKTVKKLYPAVKMDIVGGYDEDYKQAVEEAQKEGLVHYHGRQLNVHEFMKNAHCVVLPSYHEGMSNVMLEAAATGRPVITTTVPGCRETFEEGVTGLGCAAGSAESLADAMLRFIRMPYEDKEKMGLLGHKKMEREFDRNLVTDVYIKEIENVLNQNRLVK